MIIEKDKIFSIKTENEFNDIALEIFRYQYNNTPIYQEFVNSLNVEVDSIFHYLQIPFLPIQFYKTYQILDKNSQASLYFQSSGTTSEKLSKHYITDENIYQKSIKRCFELFFGDPSQYVFLGLLPSYLEKQNSSLIYMVNYLMKLSGKEENGFFLYDFEKLYDTLKKLEQKNQKVILFGVSYALLDFANFHPIQLDNTLVIETGGMKGRKKEITKEELLLELKESFQTEKIYSEYSMTELLSQAYSLKNNIYECPPWMKILIRDAEDPLSYIDMKKSGGINIIDLANLYTCSFISTQDLGRKFNENSFEILGRMDNSDIRGCSLLLL